MLYTLGPQMKLSKCLSCCSFVHFAFVNLNINILIDKTCVCERTFCNIVSTVYEHDTINYTSTPDQLHLLRHSLTHMRMLERPRILNTYTLRLRSTGRHLLTLGVPNKTAVLIVFDITNLLSLFFIATLPWMMIKTGKRMTGHVRTEWWIEGDEDEMKQLRESK